MPENEGNEVKKVGEGLAGWLSTVEEFKEECARLDEELRSVFVVFEARLINAIREGLGKYMPKRYARRKCPRALRKASRP